MEGLWDILTTSILWVGMTVKEGFAVRARGMLETQKQQLGSRFTLSASRKELQE